MADRKSFPKWLSISGWLLYPGATALGVRLLYETVYLDWKYGQQLIGYALVHNYTIFFFIGALSWILSWAWLVIALVIIVRGRMRFRKLDWIQFGLIAMNLLILHVPPKWLQPLMPYFLHH